ncbi:hypothetical protein HMPREF9449_01919 [Odoribacter laneus YIT 12061]|uniref:SHSP domain-containing protein n=1 Tax=Odoribacter laneus YIT 12061 TaxID=742817 RepID=H1DI33_9BACT|nr:hypothetical protein HMPREF9449_01919 [Odoribacter laneus YIT 12061]
MILPDNIDKEKIEAKVEHGALTVNLPKKKMNEIKKIGTAIYILIRGQESNK